MCSGIAGRTSKASWSAPVHGRPGPGASHYAQFLSYTSSELKLLHTENYPLNPSIGPRLIRHGIMEARTSFPEFAHSPHKTGHTQKQDKYRPSELTILYLNTRSLAKQKLDIFHLLDSTQPDVLFLSITWLSQESAPDILAVLPNNYYILQVNRPPEKIGGGVAAIIRKDLKFTLLTSLDLTSVDNLVIKLESVSAPLICVLLYRPPRTCLCSPNPWANR